jgi:segregation and condensation protein A
MSDTVTETAEIDSPPGDHNVQLEIFSGPLDLLLHLIKQEEVDIYDIPISKITRQYLRYVEMINTLDLEVAGEFILMAATLIRIKTRLLLPQDESDPEEHDPREELILALVEYKKYKEAGDILRERGRLEERNTIPPSLADSVEGRVELQPMTSLYDLVIAFREAMVSRPVKDVHEVKAQRVTIEERMLVIINLLRARESATLVELFADKPTKIVAVTTFVAILELTRAHRIRIHQAVPFSEVRVYPGDDIDAPLQEIDLVDYANQDQQGVAV